MGSLEDVIVPVLIGATIGLFIGYFTGRRMAPDSERNRELERQIESLKNDRTRFEQQVNAHFTDTATKLNTLTENYREVYAHIAGAAATLCSDENRPEFAALPPAAESQKSEGTIDSGSVVTEPPRDWAPKPPGSNTGTLSESYGVDKSDVPPDHSKDDRG